MELICYLEPGWAPLIRPAPATRPWMDATAESFAYRCLPLDIANAHGWEILCPCGFEAVWSGHPGTDAVTIVPDAGAIAHKVPVSLFGQGIVTFHIEGIIRTPPGWNLWVGGSPNRFKDGIQPLGGVIETDWSPYTFTMNWRFTRPSQKIRFEKHEAMCFFFPVQRSTIEAFQPRFAPLSDDPETLKRFHDWSRARNEFHKRTQIEPPQTPADRWQKHYYRGVDVGGRQIAKDHQAKLRPKPFDAVRVLQIEAVPPDDGALPHAPDGGVATPGELQTLRAALQHRDRLMEAVERQRDLAPAAAALERREALSSAEFLERYYAVARPVILEGEMATWPVSVNGISASLAAEIEMPVGTHAEGRAIKQTMAADFGALDKFLTSGILSGLLQAKTLGSITKLRTVIGNRFLCQLSGCSRMMVFPLSEMGKVENLAAQYGDLIDVSALGEAGFLDELRFYTIAMGPGDILYLPLGWSWQARAETDTVRLILENFRWANPEINHRES